MPPNPLDKLADLNPSAEPDTRTSPEAAAEAVRRAIKAASVARPETQPKVAVVFNPTKVDVDVLRAAVDAGADEAGYAEPIWLETSEDDPGHGMAEQALEEKAELVIACGGDGTVRAVADVLVDTGVSLGLLPAGTGNILARNLDLSLSNLEESVAVAFTGKDKSVDAGIAELRRADDETERHVFVVMAGLGLDAHMATHTDDDLKSKVGWLAYAHSITRSIVGGEHVRMRWSVDGGEKQTSNVHTLLIGNCGSLPGNVLLLPDAAVDDGLLDVVAMRPQGLFGWFEVWGRILVENGIVRRHQVGQKLAGPVSDSRALRYQTGRLVEVELQHPQDFELDGDPMGEVVALRLSVAPHALNVRVPAER